MEDSDAMDTAETDLSKLHIKILSTDLPDDEQIQQEIRQRKEIAMSNEGERDDDISSNCDSDVEGMENLWDILFSTREPYANTTEHLHKLLENLPTRLSTREHKLFLKYGTENYDKKYLEQAEYILNSRLLDSDIDDEILKDNMKTLKVHIKNIIKKKEKVAAQELKKNLIKNTK